MDDLTRRVHLEDPDVDTRIISKWDVGEIGWEDVN
jgi:hypothetical protein